MASISYNELRAIRERLAAVGDGADEGGVSAVAGVAPDESGNVPLTAGDLGSLTEAEVEALVADAEGSLSYAPAAPSITETLLGSRPVLQSAIGSAGPVDASGQPARNGASDDIIAPPVGQYSASDSRSIVKIVASAAGAPGNVMILARVRGSAAENAIGVYFSAVAGEGMYIFTRTNGAWGSGLASSLVANAVPAGEPRWLVVKAVGNVITGELWSGDPDVQGSVKITQAVATLTGSEATNHGAGVVGRGGLRWAGSFTGTRYLSNWRWTSLEPQPVKTITSLERGADGVLTAVMDDATRVRLAKDLGDRVAPKRVAVSNASYAADGSESVIAWTSLDGNTRTLTLPLASAYTPGRILTVKVESGGTPYLLAVNRAGTDTIDGATSLTLATPSNAAVAYAGVQLYSDGVSKWAVVRDFALAGKLDNGTGTVSLANLADAAKPALGLSANGQVSGAAISETWGQARIALTADGSATLPAAANFAPSGSGRLLLVTVASGTASSVAAPANTLTLNRTGSDTIGLSGAVSLAIPPSIGFTLLRSNGSNRWDVVAGAGSRERRQLDAVAALDPAAATVADVVNALKAA
jgi:hypothetical protein